MKTKRIISVFLAIVMCLGMVFAADAETKIPDGYTTIYTAEDFNNIRNNLDDKNCGFLTVANFANTHSAF